MEQRKGLKSWLLFGAAFLFCPCHLVFILPLLAGTAIGGVLSQYTGVVTGILAGVFAILLWFGFRFINHEK